jgi:hypothetical protein
MGTLSVWISFFTPLFITRIEVIIGDSFNCVVKQPKAFIDSLNTRIKNTDDVDRHLADYLWNPAHLSDIKSSRNAKYRIQTPSMTSFEAEFEEALLHVKKDLEPLWQDGMTTSQSFGAQKTDDKFTSSYASSMYIPLI